MAKGLSYETAMDATVRYFLSERKKASRKGKTEVTLPINNGCDLPARFPPFREAGIKCICFIIEYPDGIGQDILEELEIHHQITSEIINVPRKKPIPKGHRDADYWIKLTWEPIKEKEPFYTHDPDDI
jgi:hypothetical protein